MITGRIFDIQRFSIHDGPGIRTTVFFKGCPLRCLWCGNPESIAREPRVSYLPEKCIACGACVGVCPAQALWLPAAGKAVLDRRPLHRAAAIALRIAIPRPWRWSDANAGDEVILEVVMRGSGVLRGLRRRADRLRRRAAGAVEFLEDLLCEAKKRRAALLRWKPPAMPRGATIERVRTLVDLWLYDYKETDPRRHAGVHRRAADVDPRQPAAPARRRGPDSAALPDDPAAQRPAGAPRRHRRPGRQVAEA